MIKQAPWTETLGHTTKGGDAKTSCVGEERVWVIPEGGGLKPIILLRDEDLPLDIVADLAHDPTIV